MHAAPVLALFDVVDAIDPLDTGAVHVIGAALAADSIAATLYAQIAMLALADRRRRDRAHRARHIGPVTSGPFALAATRSSPQ